VSERRGAKLPANLSFDLVTSRAPAPAVASRIKCNAPMKHFLFLALAIASTTALAASFMERVAAAKAQAATTKGAQYEAALYSRYGEAMQACIPAGANYSGIQGDFTLVADVKPNGSLNAVEVRPQTKVSICFAARLKGMTFDAPPSTRSAGYPIHVEMQLKP
jgi:hypothetical protein